MNPPGFLGPRPDAAAAISGVDVDSSELRFHHIGVACLDLEEETRQLSALGYRPEGSDFTDPVQGIHGRFLGGQTPRLELLQPLAAGSVLEPWLKGKIKLYHLAYETPDLEKALAQLATRRAKLVVKPVPAVAFGGRRIAFVVLPNRLLVELIAAGA